MPLRTMQFHTAPRRVQSQKPLSFLGGCVHIENGCKDMHRFRGVVHTVQPATPALTILEVPMSG
jgi:hypothetical protein